MGQFRKIIIDDNIPCDEEGIPLLPMSHNIAEIWPLILSKALLKVCSFGLSPRSPEIPEFHIVTALTGWLPEVLNGSCTKTWELLQGYLAEELFEQASPVEEEPVAKDKNAKKDKNKRATSPLRRQRELGLSAWQRSSPRRRPSILVKLLKSAIDLCDLHRQIPRSPPGSLSDPSRMCLRCSRRSKRSRSQIVGVRSARRSKLRGKKLKKSNRLRASACQSARAYQQSAIRTIG